MIKSFGLSFIRIICCLQFTIAFLSIFFTSINAQPAFIHDYNKKWVDSIFLKLTLEEKIGQLLMPRANVSGQLHDEAKIIEWIEKFKIGGLVFFASDPLQQSTIINVIQAKSKTPLLIGQDLEWGLAMRLKNTDRFPYAMAMGAMQNADSLVFSAGSQIGKQCKSLGIHINFAPVVDINLNPKNPVINFRSFGENKHLVGRYGAAFMRGLQSQNIVSVAKHFPGHGDTDADSHYDLPIILHPKSRLDSVEFYPFRFLINNGLTGIMTAHLTIPSLEPTNGLASTFSHNIIHNTLRNELNFEGLIFTDALDMQGAIKNYPKGEAFVQAVLAGNDVLETFEDVPEAVSSILQAVKTGRISMNLLNDKVIKILKAKSWVGLDKYQPIDVQKINQTTTASESDIINYKMAQKSMTCVKNHSNILPITNFNQKITILSVGNGDPSEFASMAQNFADVQIINLPTRSSKQILDSIYAISLASDMLIVAFVTNDIRPARQYGLDSTIIAQLTVLSNHPKSIFCLLGNAYALGSIPSIQNYKAILLGYQNTLYTQRAIAQSLFGAESTPGRLPVSIPPLFNAGQGISIEKQYILSYGPPEIVNIDRHLAFAAIDSIILEGLNAQAFPGCVVQASKDGIVFLQKAYGSSVYTTNNNQLTLQPSITIDDAMDNTNNNTLNHTPTSILSNINPKAISKNQVYDLASLTKISATMFILLKLVSEGKFDFDAPLSRYFPAANGTNKATLTFRDMLAHRAGLQSWIPFWKDAVDTVSTIQKAVDLHPHLDSLVDWQIKKPNWIQKIFGKKKKVSITNLAQLQADKISWPLFMNSNTIAWKKDIFNRTQSDTYSVYITDSLWLHKEYLSNIQKRILDSPLLNKTIGANNDSIYPYVYSDLHFYFYPDIIRNITGKSLQENLSDMYSKLGAYSATYTPSNKSDIPPTEIDTLFRRVIIQGNVHDEGAAMIGGISGHAGLFANANDVNKIMQTYLQDGRYGKVQFFEPKVVREATAYQFLKDKNRRGIGFDKKDVNEEVFNTSFLVSDRSYGHSGFTGTYTWVDPAHNLVYVFLSNRTFPHRSNTKISTLNIRTKILDVLIDATQSYNP